MSKFSYLIIGILAVFAGCMNSAKAQSDVDARMSGSWFDQDHRGEGFLLEVLEANRAVVYWFTYTEAGEPRWFTAVGEVSGNRIGFDELLVAKGSAFGEEFNPEDVEFSDVGDLQIEWSDCAAATASYVIDGVEGSQSLGRLSTLAGLDCGGPVSSPSTLSGSWFDQTHNGEGLVVEALNDGRVLVFWFSYDEAGQQAWFYGVGEADGTAIVVPEMLSTRGGRFGPDFDPAQVQYEAWGGIQLELNCEFGKLDYASVQTAFGSGKQTLSRLTNPGNPDCSEAAAPNILLVIADDLGLDSSNQYDVSEMRPSTPVLDELAEQGLVFENFWSSPTCSPTRAGILTGKYGSRTGVLMPGDMLAVSETSLQSYIHRHLPGKYSDAVIGKWHLGPQPGGGSHPGDLGVSHFAGIAGGGVEDYEDWSLTINGQRSNETTYVTSKLVDMAIDWTGEQETPWFLWLAFNAPHTPFHLPPTNLHNRALSGSETDIADNPLPYYFAAIEALDTELGRLLDAMDQATRDNTIILFMGDNGTPGQVAQDPFSRRKAKGSIYQGGINVPFFVAGKGVSRTGQRESALINSTDLFGTIAALAGVNVDQTNDSVSFVKLLSTETDSDRLIQFSENEMEDGYEEWAISDGIYKLIEASDGTLQLYMLPDDPFENSDLVEAGLAPADVLEDLQFLSGQFRQ